MIMNKMKNTELYSYPPFIVSNITLCQSSPVEH